VKATETKWHVGSIGSGCPEIVLSERLAALAREAETEGFPFTAEHLRYLAAFVLDETALRYGDPPTDCEDDAPDPDG
jgi:hypothetical protein